MEAPQNSNVEVCAPTAPSFVDELNAYQVLSALEHTAINFGTIAVKVSISILLCGTVAHTLIAPTQAHRGSNELRIFDTLLGA